MVLGNSVIDHFHHKGFVTCFNAHHVVLYSSLAYSITASLSMDLCSKVDLLLIHTFIDTGILSGCLRISFACTTDLVCASSTCLCLWCLMFCCLLMFVSGSFGREVRWSIRTIFLYGWRYWRSYGQGREDSPGKCCLCFLDKWHLTSFISR